MDKLTLPFTTVSAYWQQGLWRSARLYLAANDARLCPLRVEAALRIIERRLVDHLQTLPIGLSPQQAWRLLRVAQWRLLCRAGGVEDLLRTISVHQAVATPLMRVVGWEEHLY